VKQVDLSASNAAEDVARPGLRCLKGLSQVEMLVAQIQTKREAAKVEEQESLSLNSVLEGVTSVGCGNDDAASESDSNQVLLGHLCPKRPDLGQQDRRERDGECE
jgi:hypothetical protein